MKFISALSNIGSDCGAADFCYISNSVIILKMVRIFCSFLIAQNGF